MGADIYIQERMKMPDVELKRIAFDNAVKARNLISDKNSEEYQKAQELVENCWDTMYPDDGYFRDSYNHSSLFWRLGLSWWKDVGDLIDKYNPVVDEETGTRLNDGLQEDDDSFDWDLDSDGIKELADLVRSAELDLPNPNMSREEYEVWCKENNFAMGEDHAYEINEWIKYWEEKKERFLKMCDNAVEKGWHMVCSI